MAFIRGKHSRFHKSSKWFMTIYFILTILPTLALLATVASIFSLREQRGITNVINELADTQKDTLTEIQSSSQMQSSTMENVGDNIAKDFGNLWKEIKTSEENRKIPTTQLMEDIGANLKAITNFNRAAQKSIADLHSFVKREYDANFQDIFNKVADIQLGIDSRNAEFNAILEVVRDMKRRVGVMKNTLLEHNKSISEFHQNIHALTPSFLRLHGGGAHDGTVEIYFDSAWGTICHHGWDINDGTVLCRMLGFRGAESVGFANTDISQPRIKRLECEGSEQSILDCEWQKAEPWGCYDATVECTVD